MITLFPKMRTFHRKELVTALANAGYRIDRKSIPMRSFLDYDYRAQACLTVRAQRSESSEAIPISVRVTYRHNGKAWELKSVGPA